jgi:hypothetical protein
MKLEGVADVDGVNGLVQTVCLCCLYRLVSNLQYPTAYSRALKESRDGSAISRCQATLCSLGSQGGSANGDILLNYANMLITLLLRRAESHVPALSVLLYRRRVVAH